MTTMLEDLVSMQPYTSHRKFFKLITCYEHYLPRTGNNSFVASAVDAVANSPRGFIKIGIPFLVLA